MGLGTSRTWDIALPQSWSINCHELLIWEYFEMLIIVLDTKSLISPLLITNKYSLLSPGPFLFPKPDWWDLRKTKSHCTTCHVRSEFISYCCCNQWPQMQQLKTTQTDARTVLEARSQKPVSLHWNQGVGRLRLLEKPIPCLLLPASGGCPRPLACSCITVTPLSTVTFPSLALTRLPLS